MVLSEVFLSAFLQVLFDRLASRELLNFARPEEVGSKLKKWEKTLKMIESVLNDAEEKQLTDKAVKMWLDDLQDLAYDVEDILDEFATEALNRKFVTEHQASSSKGRSLIPAFFNSCSPSVVKFDFNMRSKIKDITRRMEDLCKQRTDLGLERTSGGSSIAEWPRLPPTTCLRTEPAVYGRDDDKAKIIRMMSTSESSDGNFVVIPIVGMGGLGKTTLARDVFNDKVMEDFKFDTKAWVCVSDDFDLLRISKALLESITHSSCDLKELNEVQLQLKKEIADKKFLLVLDDVWSSQYSFWETLKSPFMAGASGSKIIVTTRHENVASTVASDRSYNLKLLSDDDCWSVFMKHAFKGRDVSAHQNMELIRDKVVEKCRGLPLAARTLGGLLHSKKGEDKWDHVLNSKIWDLPNENEILPVLKLSYFHLPSYLKRCFAYCAILPKDYEFEEQELVFLWMAECLVQDSKGNYQLEDLAIEYFHDLVARSIFQQSNTNNSRFIMHDLINDLAQWASGEISFRSEDVMGTNKQLKDFEKVRYASYISHYLNGKNKFEVFHRFENLRTFLPIALNDRIDCLYVSKMVLSDLLSKFKKLRVLSLKKYFITELPNSIGDLKHLRYLNLSNTYIRNLPESTSLLFNLQSLILRKCRSLVKLPSNMSHLINLRHLDIKGVNRIEEMPLGMKDLRCLQTLSKFIVGKNTGSSLKDLKDLKFLKGEIYISRLENVIDSRDIRGAILSDKKGLKVLSLEWSSEVDNSRDEVKDESVLNMLQPHENIKELTIKGYGSKRFPCWIGDSSLSNMVVLRLEYCKTCTSLPSIGQLRSLKDVTIRGIIGIRSIGSEFYGESCSKPFQLLETLCFEDLQEWEYWDPIIESKHVENFPHLRKLSIVKCPKLTGRLPDNLPSLEELVIRECQQLVVSCSSLPVRSDLEIDGSQEMVRSNPIDSTSLNSLTRAKISEFSNWLKQGYQKVERLRLIDCEKLMFLWQNEISLDKPPEGLYCCSSLKTLIIQDCPGLISFPEVDFFPILSELKIINCNALTSLPDGMKHANTCLECLYVEYCHSLTFIVKGQLPPSLKRLSIRNCEKLQVLFDDIEDSCNSSTSFSSAGTSLLEDLFILKCPSLTCLSSRLLPAMIKQLEIRSCSNLMTLSSTGQLPEALSRLNIHDCYKLESIAKRLDSNMSLRSIVIWGCENLNSLPEGLCSLNHLDHVLVVECPNFVCFPVGGLPNTNLSVTLRQCEKLKDVFNNVHSNRLQGLRISNCSIIKFPAEGFPTNLKELEVPYLTIFKPLKDGGFQFTSLTDLTIRECPDAVSFPQDELQMILPTSLIRLSITSFPKLKYLSSKGFQDLTSLLHLEIEDCPQLSSFPEEGLPSSLLQLWIADCPLLKNRCKMGKGREWPKIADIPFVVMDNIIIYSQEEIE